MARKRDFNEHTSEADHSEAVPSSPPARDTLPPSSPPDAPFEDDMEQDIDDLEEEEEGEDLYDTLAGDYAANSRQDRYDLDAPDIDEQEYSDLDVDERRKVDAMLRARARGENIDSMQARDGSAQSTSYLESDVSEGELPMTSRFRSSGDAAELETVDADDRMGSDDEEDRLFTLQELSSQQSASTLEWITQPVVHRTIAREFRTFLLEYTDDKGHSVYGTRIMSVGENNSESLMLDFQHLQKARALIAYYLVAAPTPMLKIMDSVVMHVVELQFPNFSQIHSELHVRVVNLPVVLNLRQLREHHLNTLVRVTGVVTRRTGVFPQLKYVKFDCVKCGAQLGPFVQDSNQEIKVSYCQDCQSRGPFVINKQNTIYRNYQRLTLQESPGTVPAGRLPRHREVILLADLIDSAKPGDEVDMVAIYKNAFDFTLNVKNGFPVFATVLEADSVQRRDAGILNEIRLSEIEEREIRKISQSPTIVEDIINSIAPSIYGHKNIKTALACALFGGVPKETGKITLRGDINVLLLGDPGTAKSQFLKYAEKTATRAVFATGQGASAVGLTASVRKDPITREWTLEGGALVLADKGMCLIDEFDKMNDQDRTSIHEAMEQQSISVSKAGIVANLKARCSVVAAANPRYGRYNASETLMSNVDLTEPILSRFDIVCVVQDLVNEEHDDKLARFVVGSHAKASARAFKDAREHVTPLEENAEPEFEGPISQDMLRKYIHYARTHVKPQLRNIDQGRIAGLYSALRAESIKTGSFPITVRHLESIIRTSEAFARIRLSEYVSSDDVTRAIRVIVDSFIQSQKMNHRRALRQNLLKYTY